MAPGTTHPSEADEPIDFRALYYAIYEKRYWVAAVAIATVVAACVYLLATPKVYAAQTIVQVEQTPHKILNIQDIANEDLNATELLRTIEQNLANEALLGRVVETLHLDGGALGLPPRSEPYKLPEITRALRDHLSVKLVKGTRLIAVRAESQRPEFAQQLSLTIVNEYRKMNREQRLNLVTDTNSVLSAEANKLKEKLQKSEQALQDYKERTQAVSLQETQNIIVEKLKELSAKLTAAKTQRMKLEADVSQAQKLGDSAPEDLLKLSSVAEAKAVVDQKRIVADQEGLVANLSKRYGPLHPKLIQAKSQLDAQKASLNDLIKRTAASINSTYEAAKDTEAKYEQALHEQEQKALELNKLAIPYAVLQREVESDRALYDAVLARMKETDVTKSIQQDDIIVKSPAVVPDRPVRPRKLRILAGSMVLGVLLGAGLVLLLRAWDTSIRTVAEADQVLKVPVLAVIPAAAPAAVSDTPLIMLTEPSGYTAESVRTLRTALSLHGDAQRTIMFTSALAGEGKTFCAINYGAACAQQGLQTLLIDADLRLRSVARVLLADDGGEGVADILRDEVDWDACVQTTRVVGLSVISAGRRAPNPLELLASGRFHLLLRTVRQQFNRVIIDSAPVNAVSDSLLLAKEVEEVCLVVRYGRTPRHAAARAEQKLRDAGANIRGYVLNAVPGDARLAAYYDYSAGEYGKGVYGADEIVAITEAPNHAKAGAN
jgi:succinoglycan biosynthesis transport protein ExoP